MTDNSVSEEALNDVPATEVPVAEEASKDATVTEAPVVEEVVPVESSNDVPVTEAPVSEEALNDVPATEVPVAEEASKDATVTEAPVAEKVATGKVLNEDDEKVAIEILQRVLLGNNTALGDYTVEQILNTIALLRIEKSEIEANQALSAFKAQLIYRVEGNKTLFNQELDKVPGVVELKQKYQANIAQSKSEYADNAQKVLEVFSQEKLDATRDSADFAVQPNISMNQWLADNSEVIRGLSGEIQSLTKPKAAQNTDVNQTDAPIPSDDKPSEQVATDAVPFDDKPSEQVATDAVSSDDKPSDPVSIEPDQGLSGEVIPDSGQ